jgi:hypothetical protein
MSIFQPFPAQGPFSWSKYFVDIFSPSR